MADAIVFFDPAAAPGVKFPSPAVRTELGQLAPSTIAPKEVTEPKLDDASVSRRTIIPGAVGTVEIATGGVDTPNYKDGSITGDKIAAGALTGDVAGIGIFTVVNSDGDLISLRGQVLTTAEYNLLSSTDSGTIYLTTA